jgi:aspartyl-tRNA(Asn)/glutamyl-tRNA(Gln) amidotransferase subunit B
MNAPLSSTWEAVIGLEIHAQLNTTTKLFTRARNQFGGEPNTHLSHPCTAQPGSLPILNRTAVTKAIRFGLAIHADVASMSLFDRKSYFYPDTPRNYQITQYYAPLLRGGHIEVILQDQTCHHCAIDRAHLEDDTGMLKHFPRFTGIDFNRAGAPLLEIVSKPCLHSPMMARSYAQEIRNLLICVDASDGNMEEGGFRMDANISVRPLGETALRPRVEIKNLNSFTFMEKALQHEIQRQITLYETYPNTPFLTLIPPGTYRWDQINKMTVLMRKKESADDYRYFPEPDLPPLIVSDTLIQSLKHHMPELPQARYLRYITKLQLSTEAASLLKQDYQLANYFDQAQALIPEIPAQLLANWILVEFRGRLTTNPPRSLTSANIHPKEVATLVASLYHKELTSAQAKECADEMVKHPNFTLQEILQHHPEWQGKIEDRDIDLWIEEVLQAHPNEVQQILNGRDRVFGFLVGEVMSKSKKKASPQVVTAKLQQRLRSLDREP